jgi:SNF2 family DNA or RNA helicase
LVQDLIYKGEKVIIWAMFISNIESLSRFLSQKGVDNRVLYGATPVATDEMDDDERELTREGIVKQFHDPNCPYKVIIANAFAVAESISLHKACHNAIYMERSFNCAHYMQSKDRIHRYGLPAGTVTNYYYLVSGDSIDETIDERLTIKENRLIEIMESMPIPLFSNVIGEGGDDDVKAVLRDYARRIKTK